MLSETAAALIHLISDPHGRQLAATAAIVKLDAAAVKLVGRAILWQ
jgi:hypothetical protein